MIKFHAAKEAVPGSHSLPLLAGDLLILLTSLEVPAHSLEDHLTLKASVKWGRPSGRDIGQLDLFLCRDEQPPVLLAELDANCFVVTETLLEYEGPCHTEGSVIYSLRARSYDERALILGPVRMSATVEG